MESRWSKARNGLLFVTVASAIYFLTLPSSHVHRTTQTVTSYGDEYRPKPFHERRTLPQPVTIAVQEIEEEGNFSIWANARSGNNVQYERTSSPEDRGEGPARGLFSRPKFIEEIDDDSNYDPSDTSQGGGGEEERVDVSNDQISERRALERIRKEREWFSLSEVQPHGGNALPNYLLRGIREGISPGDYRRGIVAFLHHNKAAGSSIKVCLNTMVKRGVMANHSLLVLSSKVLTRDPIEAILEHSALVGGYTFGFCERYPGENCSYFTVMRDPYDRVLSSYFYCKVQPWDQLCGPIPVSNFTIEQWAVYQGSYFFHQLLMDARYCKQNEVIGDLFKYELDKLHLPPGAKGHFTPKRAHMCWLKQRMYFNSFVDDPGREALLQNVLDNLEGWFSVIGLTEDFDLSLRMMSATYGLPFYRRCRGRVSNKTPRQDSGKDEQSNARERLKLEMQQSPEVVEALSYDMRIYERGKEIFRRQKEQLERLTESTKVTKGS